jgi:hypothetical protein
MTSSSSGPIEMTSSSSVGGDAPACKDIVLPQYEVGGMECSGGGSAAVTGSGGEVPQCESVCSVAGGNTWETQCQGNSCACILNNETVCHCEIDSGEFCGGIPSCCPAPWPQAF